MKDRVGKLMVEGATFTKLGFFIHTENMVITMDKLTSSQKHFLNNIEKKKADKINKKSVEEMEGKLNVKKRRKKIKVKQKVVLKDWIIILKYVLIITSSDYMIS